MWSAGGWSSIAVVSRADPATPADAAGQRVALVAAATSGFLTPFMGSAVTIALPAIAAEFRLGAVSLGWVTSAFLLAAAALLLPFGRLADIVGRRRVFIAGLVVFTVATVLCAIAPSGEVLIALRLLQGAGGGLSGQPLKQCRAMTARSSLAHP